MMDDLKAFRWTMLYVIALLLGCIVGAAHAGIWPLWFFILPALGLFHLVWRMD